MILAADAELRRMETSRPERPCEAKAYFHVVGGCGEPLDAAKQKETVHRDDVEQPQPDDDFSYDFE